MSNTGGDLSPVESSQIPIYVGITGHIDVENEQELMEHISDILIKVCEEYESTPVIVLSPLAEGADRAAARAVLELNSKNNTQVSFMVVLPMEEKEYLETFSNLKSKNEYKELKNKATGCLKVPLNEKRGVDSIQEADKRHEMLYANLGIYIALNSQILIAAWNGEEEKEASMLCMENKDHDKLSNETNRMCFSDGGFCPYKKVKQGGTYQVLRTRFFGIEEEFRGEDGYLANREFGPVYWIKTKRKSSSFIKEGPAVVGPVFPDFPIEYTQYDFENYTETCCKKLVIEWLENKENLTKSSSRRKKFPNKAERKTYVEILSRLNEYNRDIKKVKPRLGDDIVASKRYFTTYYNNNSGSELEETFTFGKSENLLLDKYSAADTLSLYFQARRKRNIIQLTCMAFFGLLAFNLYSGPVETNWFILAYSIIYLVATIYYLTIIKKNRYHDRYLEYRGIAEALRVQFFWNLMGIKTKVTDKYLTKQKSSIEWIRIAVNNCLILYLSESTEVVSEKSCGESIETAYKLWLVNQQNYYNRKTPEKKRTEDKQNTAERYLFIIAWSVAVILAAMDTYEFITVGTCGTSKMFLPLISDSTYEEIHKWFVFTVGFLPVIIASFKVFTELLAFSKLARNYNWMRMIYNMANHEFIVLKKKYSKDEAEFIKKCRQLFFELGQEALLENGEWIGIFQERAPEMPK